MGFTLISAPSSGLQFPTISSPSANAFASFSAKLSIKWSDAFEPCSTALVFGNCFGEWTHTTTLTTSAAVQLPCHHRPSDPESPRWIFHLSSETVESTTNRLTLWYITWISSSRQPKFERGSEDITPSHASWALLEPFMDWQIPKWTVNALRLVEWFYAKIHCGYYD